MLSRDSAEDEFDHVASYMYIYEHYKQSLVFSQGSKVSEVFDEQR